MPTEMTIEAAIIELNRLKSQERMDIDRERLTAAVVKSVYGFIKKLWMMDIAFLQNV